MEVSDLVIQVAHSLQARTHGKVDIHLANVLSPEALQRRLYSEIKRRVPEYDSWQGGTIELYSQNSKGKNPFKGAWYSLSTQAVLGQRQITIDEQDFGFVYYIDRRVILKEGSLPRFYKKSNPYTNPNQNEWETVVDEREQRQMLDNFAADISRGVDPQTIGASRPTLQQLRREALGIAA